MNTDQDKALRQHLVAAMRGHEAHLDFDSAIEDFPEPLRGRKPAGAPHTAWQLLEHMRIAQWDILEFSRDAKHKSPKWPDEYWPKTDAPPDSKAWDESVRKFRHDAKEMEHLVQDSGSDLFGKIPHGSGQTLLREALLVASHNSYHLGQLVYLKKMLLSGK
jgi:hypothetical protein